MRNEHENANGWSRLTDIRVNAITLLCSTEEVAEDANTILKIPYMHSSIMAAPAIFVLAIQLQILSDATWD